MQASPPVFNTYLRRIVHPLSIRALIFCAIAAVLSALWSPLAPTRLFDFDAVNFALALDYFQPAAHQPQPPGYPLYVALTKVIHLFVEDVALTFLIAGLLGAAFAILLLWILGERMFGRQTGIFAALLFMTNPILWQTGLADQVRIYIAVISIGVALAVWPAWQSRMTPHRFAISGLLLGLLAGFRPEMLVSMAPLPMIAAVRSRMKVSHYLVSALAVCAGMAPWLIVLLARVGGFAGFLALLRVYSAEQASGSSALFGAGWNAAWKMLAEGLWWASLGVVAWLPAVFLVRWKTIAIDRDGKLSFLAVWFLSLILFSIVVHIAASGHALGFIPVLCLAGGWVLCAVGAARGRGALLLCLILALSLNVIFFFKPYSEAVKEASFPTVEWIRNNNETTLQKIDWITQQHSAFLVSDNATVSWRILEYYYPKTPLLYLPSPLAPTSQPAWLIENRLRVRDMDPNSEMMLPACGTIVWLVTDDQSKQELRAVRDAEDQHYFISTPVRPGMHFRIGRYHLATSPRSCQPTH